ncbi:glutaredoxin [Fictibacillus macauensis ZFHKF-1]|uniref:Glutaredoxin n=1 Tax=Fictibacillus macauensis ZFHKF-1 TaxID=1196324 RepID=I8AMV9_9BACL|nr:glutaredoxin family protein [Fictibacillus macauensis]EIT87039.1 glutaredoxin [Fictibacillus macauensis ZFHKF-1]
MSTNIQFYTKHLCPLCEEAHTLLVELQEELKLSIEVIDIYESDDLVERYGLMIPVVSIDGETLLYGKLNKDGIRKRLLTNNK